MRSVLGILIISLLSSCIGATEITFHTNGTATVLQDYRETINYAPYVESSGTMEVYSKERAQYESALTSNFQDFSNDTFKFDISDSDSTGNYLSGFPKGLMQFRMLGDSMCIIEIPELKQKPVKYPNITYTQVTLRFEREIKAVSNSHKANAFWDRKKKPREVTIGIDPMKLWRKKGNYLIAVKLQDQK